jgi:glyoxylase I family protein
MAKVLGLEHIGLVTANLNEAVRFFCEILDCSVLKKWRMDDKGIDFVMLEAGGGRIELLSFGAGLASTEPEDFPPRKVGVGHICFRVSDLAQIQERLEKAGVPLLSPIRQGQFHRRCLFCRGPDNTVLELVEV